MKIVDYIILRDYSDGIEKQVNEKIKEGYQPYGDVIYTSDTGVFKQVMVKYEDDSYSHLKCKC